MRPEDRERLLVEVESRVVARHTRAAQEGAGPPLDEVLGDTLFQEQRRLKTQKPSKARDADRALWDEVRRGLPNASEQELRDMSERVVGHYAREICGNFSDSVYRFSTSVLPPALGVLLNAVSPRKLARSFPHLPALTSNLRLQGELDYLRELDRHGTLIFAPTHLSNLDSIILGWCIYEIGLPPVLYGAGLNLFSNPLLSFFMGNLGAYTVDRRKKNALYKEVLKTYATCTMEFGYNNLFFPGGTRSRSGAVERHLKLGLLGTGLTAYVNNLQRQKPQPNLYIVPCTLSYQLVLEAETLIDDWLQEAGKSRYIITDDEFTKPRRVAAFFTQLLSLDSSIYFTAGKAMDCFGNPVDEQGVSYDPMGRAFDPSRYVLNGDGPVHDAQRDAEYTREAGEQVAKAFLANNVVYSTHVLARTMFRLLQRKNPGLDLFRLLRTGGRERNVELREVYAELDHLLDQLRALAAEGKIRLDADLARDDAEAVTRDGLRHFAIYHTTPAVQRKGDRLAAADRNLMLYYANRLDGYSLDGIDATGPRARPLN